MKTQKKIEKLLAPGYYETSPVGHDAIGAVFAKVNEIIQAHNEAAEDECCSGCKWALEEGCGKKNCPCHKESETPQSEMTEACFKLHGPNRYCNECQPFLR